MGTFAGLPQSVNLLCFQVLFPRDINVRQPASESHLRQRNAVGDGGQHLGEGVVMSSLARRTPQMMEAAITRVDAFTVQTCVFFKRTRIEIGAQGVSGCQTGYLGWLGHQTLRSGKNAQDAMAQAVGVSFDHQAIGGENGKVGDVVQVRAVGSGSAGSGDDRLLANRRESGDRLPVHCPSRAVRGFDSLSRISSKRKAPSSVAGAFTILVSHDIRGRRR